MEEGEQDGGRRGAKRAEEESDGDREEQRSAKGRFRPGLGLQLDMESQRTSVLHRVVNFAPDPLPARQYDRETTEPISFYLLGLEELLAWKPTSDDAFNVSTELLAKRQPSLNSRRPRTLVCHDMKGGYLEDRFIQGALVRNPYVFYHWRYIDIFVYFSHHTVTIPPVVWTNAAHRNGVLMLGTFITEWTDGAKMCESFLAGEEEAYRAVAEQLAAIAQFYCFDGWLVNIENSLSVSAAHNMPHFLRYLTAQVHRAVPGGQVVWYDSVLQSGELRWQNELNEKNRVYFDACDGFFTNYNWKEEHLLRTRETADDRRTDIYVGVDVFGRGEVVSSGFDTNKSLRMIRKQGLSVAIFAPGWVYEHLGPTDFLNNEDKFWALLSELLPTHSVGSLPFCTSFSLGMGKRHFSNGQERRTEPWYNLSAQEIQPMYAERRMLSGGWLRTRSCLQDAWCGGNSLLLEGVIPLNANHVTVRLFSFQMPAPPRLFLVFIYKPEASFQALTFAPEFTTRESRSCLSSSEPALPGPRSHKPTLLRAPPPHLAQLLKENGPHGERGWQSRCYELELQNCFLDELSVTVSSRQSGQSKVPFACRLGKVWVLDGAAVHLLSPADAVSPMSPMDVSHVRWQRASSGQLSLSLTLRWTYPPSKATCFHVHYRSRPCATGPDRPLLQIGEAHASLYRVTELTVPDASSESSCHLEFLVEPVADDGVRVDTAMWGKLVFVYSDPKLPSTDPSA
ncbi:cytosolic endo-beta-N-acetylglucosaminidase isoform X2 [Rhineura floridana]|uniref:cytosolic endo-beta-N-acetylglucosaminidase isoform X2 n=1 Tax=Rhineura floridana TaxID=261503 RepID=UPI002AC80B7A|nr:cytosolic endo-beta-N-acetylglucosaminidase isoform X2 [Rhineura floridana]